MIIHIDFSIKPNKASVDFKQTKKMNLVDLVKQVAQQRQYQVIPYRKNQFGIEICHGGLINFDSSRAELEATTQTSLIGPGFHKAVIDFIDILKDEIPGEFEINDDAAYAAHRDFARLQQAHLEWLRSSLVSLKPVLDQQKSVRINWPENDWSPNLSQGIITLTGVFDPFDFNTMDWQKFGRDFFIWFSEDRDAYFFRGLALFIMWNHLNWISPPDESEKVLIGEILNLLEQARRLDPHIPLPLGAWRELASVSGQDPLNITGADLPFSTPVGYRRGELCIQLPDGWGVRLPGSFHEDNGSSQVVYWENDRNLRFSSFTLKAGMGIFKDLYLRLFQRNQDAEKAQVITHVSGEYRYQGKWDWVEDENTAQKYWCLQGVIEGGKYFAVATITWNNEKWKDWALQTFVSITPPETEIS